MDAKKIIARPWFLSLLSGLLFPAAATGQTAVDTTLAKQWTLQECIRYAREKNLTVQNAQVSFASMQADVKQAAANRYPSLSASVSQGFSHANRAAEASSGSTSASPDDYSYTGNYQLSSALTLYNGGKLNNTLTQKKTDAQARSLDVDKAQNSIEIAVTQSYLEILYARESVKINQTTAETSLSQLRRAEGLLKAGSIAQSDYAQIESQYASDKYQLVAAQNTLDRNILSLKQLLELEAGYDFRISFPEINDPDASDPLPASTEVYTAALHTMPEIKSAALDVQSAQLGEKIARASGIPSVSLSAGIGTGHATTSSDAFSRQLDRNLSQNVGLSVSIPIFNHRTTRTSVEKARLQTLSADISLQSAKKTLLSTVESLWQDAVSAQSRYTAAGEKLRAATISYDLVSRQFDAGMKNTVELLQEKNNYLSAQMESVQAKYQAVLSRKLLDFYRGRAIAL